MARFSFTDYVFWLGDVQYSSWIEHWGVIFFLVNDTCVIPFHCNITKYSKYVLDEDFDVQIDYHLIFYVWFKSFSFSENQW